MCHAILTEDLRMKCVAAKFGTRLLMQEQRAGLWLRFAEFAETIGTH